MRKIVICPIFCEAHLIDCQIDNIIDTINPDIIIYNEGVFPTGPEGSTNPEFIKKYTKDGKRGFDYNRLENIIKNAQNKHPYTQIILHPKEYKHKDASLNYIDGCSNFEELGINIYKGDLIFPYEADIFHLESDKDKLEECYSHLTLDEGFTTNWIDFIGSQYYLHCADISRKICIKFGTMDFYKAVLSRFQKQKYNDLLYHASITTFHMSWFRPLQYRTMRYDQLDRNPKYWQTFESGIKEIRIARSDIMNIKIRDRAPGSSFTYAQYYGGPWPKALENHECWIK